MLLPVFINTVYFWGEKRSKSTQKYLCNKQQTNNDTGAKNREKKENTNIRKKK